MPISVVQLTGPVKQKVCDLPLDKEGLRLAVQELKQGLAKARGDRERFYWQLTLARRCFIAKKNELTKTQFESLDPLLQSFGLSSEEPDLVLDVLRMIYCCKRLPQPHEVRESEDETHRRLCHLDLRWSWSKPFWPSPKE